MPLPLAVPSLLAGLGALLSRLVASRVGIWIISGLSWLGLAIGTQTFVVEPLINQVMSYANAGAAAQWIVFFNIDRATTMILSAYGARAAAGGLRARLVKRI